MPICLKQYSEIANAGDLASSAITSYLTGQDVELIGEQVAHQPNLIAIGSILHWADAHSLVWGAGFISRDVPLTVRPSRVLAVRGPLTLERLHRYGIPGTPAIGDPGIFISDVFPPSAQTVPLGVVPHYVDARAPELQAARGAGMEILDVTAPLGDYIRKLSACRKIITSSLHGLVFAHAYGIPAVWWKLSNDVHGDGFKFYDYYASIGFDAKDVPVFGPDDDLEAVSRNCTLPRTAIDKAALRDSLINALPSLIVPASRSAAPKPTADLDLQILVPPGDAHEVLLRERILRTSLFDPDEYLAMHEDLKGAVDPLQHYVSSGIFELRRGVTQHSVARLLGRIEQDHARDSRHFLEEFGAAQLETGRHRELIGHRSIAVYVHSRANYYMHPIARALVHALQSAGADCRLANEYDVAPDEATIPIVVAPHEFFGGRLPAALRHPAFLMRSILLNTEQIPSPWLVSGLPWLYAARGILDLGFQASLMWQRGGIPSIYLVPPFDAVLRRQVLADFDRADPRVQWMAPDSLDLVDQIELIAERPLDVFFAGYAAPARTRFFLRNARYLATRNCSLSYDSGEKKTMALDATTRKQFAASLGLCLLSRVSLNLGRFAVGQLQWERTIALGMACGTPVITSLCLRSPFFKSNVHYLEAPQHRLDGLIRHTLETPEGLARAQAVARRARRVMEFELTAPRVGRQVLSFLARVA